MLKGWEAVPFFTTIPTKSKEKDVVESTWEKVVEELDITDDGKHSGAFLYFVLSFFRKCHSKNLLEIELPIPDSHFMY